MPDLVDALISVSTLFSATYLVIDALDECERAQRGILLQVIGRLLEANFKVFTTCRPHTRDVRRFFHEAPKIHIVADTSDIKSYLNTRLDDQMSLSSMLKNRIVDTLSLSAQGVYGSGLI